MKKSSLIVLLLLSSCAIADADQQVTEEVRPNIRPASYITITQCSKERLVGVFVFADGRQVMLDPKEMTVEEFFDWSENIPENNRVNYELNCYL